jgi:hypothetical protein
VLVELISLISHISLVCFGLLNVLIGIDITVNIVDLVRIICIGKIGITNFVGFSPLPAGWFIILFRNALLNIIQPF